MNKRFVGVLMFAAAVSLAASFVVYRMVVARMASNTVPATAAVFALRDLAAGSLLRAEDVKLGSWKGDLPKQAITAINEAADRGIMIPIHEGDLIMQNSLAPKGVGAGLAVKIPNGMRAVAVKVNEVVGLAGFIMPHMRVDVIACGMPPGDARNTTGSESRIVLQNIEVLSAGPNIEQDKDGKPVPVQVVNLLVTPQQAEIMSLAGNETKVQLVMRNPSDAQLTNTQGTATADLFNSRPRPVVARRSGRRPVPLQKPVQMVPVAVPITMEVISGAKRQDMKVGETIVERPAEEKAK